MYYSSADTLYADLKRAVEDDALPLAGTTDSKSKC
jgi:hypothetical protein